MNHRERILAAVHHEPLDRIPTDMWATVEVQEQLLDHFGIDAGVGLSSDGVSFPEDIGLMGGALSRGPEAILAVWEMLDVDGIFSVGPPYIGPPLVSEGDYSVDPWGFGRRVQEYATGEYLEQVYYLLAEAETLADIDAYRWPDPNWYDYEAVPGLVAQCGGRAIGAGYSALFYYHNLLRGLELSLMDPLMRPEFTRYLVQHISDFFLEYHRRLLEAARGAIDVTQVTDDYGSQHGLLISPRIFEEFYRAPMQRSIDLARSYGITVFHHDDGDCRRLLPTFVEMGVQVLNPIQWRCGNWDLPALKAEFGEDFCFHSAVDNQQTLPFGTPGDVRSEVRMLIEALASDRTGLIVGPCHNLQANTPLENIVALYEATREYGTFE